MQLSPHFSLEEFIYSGTAVRRGIDNRPTQEHLSNMALVAQMILEPVRAHFGVPIRVSSGYRSEKLNRAVGGARSSQHCNGEAVDFTVQGVPNEVVCQWIAQNLMFDQLILEFPPSGWVHCSFTNDRPNRKSILTAKKTGTKTAYIPGIHP